MNYKLKIKSSGLRSPSVPSVFSCSKFLILFCALCFLLFDSEARAAGISVNKSLMVGTNNVLPPNETNFFDTNIVHLTNALANAGFSAGLSAALQALSTNNAVNLTNIQGSNLVGVISAAEIVLYNALTNWSYYYQTNAANFAYAQITTNAHLHLTDEHGATFDTGTNGVLKIVSPGGTVLLTNASLTLPGTLTVGGEILDPAIYAPTLYGYSQPALKMEQFTPWMNIASGYNTNSALGFYFDGRGNLVITNGNWIYDSGGLTVAGNQTNAGNLTVNGYLEFPDIYGPTAIGFASDALDLQEPVPWFDLIYAFNTNSVAGFYFDGRGNEILTNGNWLYVDGGITIHGTNNITNNLPAGSTTIRGGFRIDGTTLSVTSGDILGVIGGGGSTFASSEFGYNSGGGTNLVSVPQSVLPQSITNQLGLFPLSAMESSAFYSNFLAFGDSYCVGYYSDGVSAGTYTNAFWPQITNAIQYPNMTNYGVASYGAADQIGNIFSKPPLPGTEALWELGINDAAFAPSAPSAYSIEQVAQWAWISMYPSALQTGVALHAAGAFSSGWSLTSGADFHGYNSTTPGNWLGISNVYGSSFVIGFLCYSNTYQTVATFSVTVDGVPAGTLSCQSPQWYSLLWSQHFVVGAQIFAGFSNITHTILLTNTSSSSQLAGFEWIAVPGMRTNGCNKVLALEIPRAVTYQSGETDQTVDSFNLCTRSNALLFQSLGLPVYYVPISGILPTNLMIGTGGVHPNSYGHTNIAQAFLGAHRSIMPQFGRSLYTGAIAATGWTNTTQVPCLVYVSGSSINVTNWDSQGVGITTNLAITPTGFLTLGVQPGGYIQTSSGATGNFHAFP